MIYFGARHLANTRSQGSKSMGSVTFDVLCVGKKFFSRDAIPIKQRNRLSVSKPGVLRLYLTEMTPHIKSTLKIHLIEKTPFAIISLLV